MIFFPSRSASPRDNVSSQTVRRCERFHGLGTAPRAPRLNSERRASSHHPRERHARAPTPVDERGTAAARSTRRWGGERESLRHPWMGVGVHGDDSRLLSDYAGPTEGVMRQRRQRAKKAAEDAPRDTSKRRRANERDIARGGELGVGDARGGAPAGGASRAAASRVAPARAGRRRPANAAPARLTLPRAAKVRHPLACVDPNRQCNPLEARGDGAGGTRGAP